MAMISLSPDALRFGERLPFGLFDHNGLLLVPSGVALDDSRKLQRLRAKALYVAESDADIYRRWSGECAEKLVADEATLQHISQARSTVDRRRSQAAEPPRTPRKRTLPETFDELVRHLHLALRSARPEASWVEQVEGAVDELHEFSRRHPDATLFLLIQHVSQDLQHYSTCHATLCAFVCSQIATMLKWPEAEVHSLAMAACTMNASVSALQDQLAQQSTPLSPDQQALIAQHAANSAELLAGAGVTDVRWIDLVRRHHDETLRHRPLEELSPTERGARLLNMVDSFTAQISLRASRAPIPPLLAAQRSCVGEDGRPDALGAALIRTLGMYPPGSYVELANREVAVVLARGLRVNEPVVASVVGPSGMALTSPALRHTSTPARAVTQTVAVRDVRVRLNAERVLALL